MKEGFRLTFYAFSCCKDCFAFFLPTIPSLKHTDTDRKNLFVLVLSFFRPTQSLFKEKEKLTPRRCR